MRPSLLIAAITAACASQTVAKGINCEGSGWCTSAGTGVAAALTDLIMTIDDSRWYSNGEHIACTQSKAYLGAPDVEGDIGYCAFLQNTGGTWGSQIKVLAPYIGQHGCRNCGSVPYSWVSGAWNGNDVSGGELTFNMVTMGPSATCTDGVC